MKKIISMNTLDASSLYPTTGFNQIKKVDFNGGYLEIYINQTEDIPNEIIIFQERSALALEYLTYYLNPNTKIRLICGDMVIDELEFDDNSEDKEFIFCKDNCQVTFSLETNELRVNSDSNTFPMSSVEVNWHISQSNNFDSVVDLVDILESYKCCPEDLSSLDKLDQSSQPYYFDDWDGILRLIHNYQIRDSFTRQKEITIRPFVNFSKPLFDACFRQGEGGASYFPLFLNNINSNQFFVDFIVDYILDDIKDQLETIVVVIPYSFLMTFDGEYLFQTLHYIRELIFPRLNIKKLLISYKDDQGTQMHPKVIEGALNDLKALCVGSSYLLATYLMDCLCNNNSFEIDSCEPVKSDASFFKKRFESEINSFNSSDSRNLLNQHNHDLSILNWQYLVTSNQVNHISNRMSSIPNREISETYLNMSFNDIKQKCKEKKDLKDRSMIQNSEDVGLINKEIKQLKQALVIKSYDRQRFLRAHINWLRFYNLILIKKRMLETFIDRLNTVGVPE